MIVHQMKTLEDIVLIISLNMEENLIEKSVLVDTINKLSSKEREILKLRYYTGKTQTEISSIVGISQAQVSRLEKNALKQLYEELV